MIIGYIFIGSFYNGIFNCKIAKKNPGIYPCATPDEIEVNQEYRLMSSDGANIRQRIPDTVKYSKQNYECIPIIGYIYPKDIFAIIELPVKIETDYWVKIEYDDTQNVRMEDFD